MGRRRPDAEERARTIARLETELGLAQVPYGDPPTQPFEEDVEADRMRRNMERLIDRRGRRGGLSRREIEALKRAFVSDDG